MIYFCPFQCWRRHKALRHLQDNYRLWIRRALQSVLLPQRSRAPLQKRLLGPTQRPAECKLSLPGLGPFSEPELEPALDGSSTSSESGQQTVQCLLMCLTGQQKATESCSIKKTFVCFWTGAWCIFAMLVLVQLRAHIYWYETTVHLAWLMRFDLLCVQPAQCLSEQQTWKQKTEHKDVF